MLWHVVDESLIDGTVNGSATVAQRVGGRLRRIQSGNTRSYASWMVMGAIGVTALLLGFWSGLASMPPHGHLLSVITFLPLLGVLALLCLRAEDQTWMRRIALVTSLADLIISLLMLPGFRMADSGYQFREMCSLDHRASHSLPPRRRRHQPLSGLADHLSDARWRFCCSWTASPSACREFFIMLLVLEVGVIGVFVSLDLFLFFFFWEVMLIPMYFLIGIWGHDRQIYAAMKFILYTMLGSILMLVAIIWLYNLTGIPSTCRISIAALQSGAVQVLRSRTEMLLFGAFFLAFAIKVPLFPLHTWLPDAHTEAPTAGSVMLAGVMLKMGTYGMLRFCLPLFPEASHRFAPLIAVLAIIGIIYGALVAMVQPDLKRLVAYSSVSHLGFVVLGIFAFSSISIQGAIYQMLNHGISTGALFLVVGMLYDRRHTYEINEYGGLATPIPN